jgi:hypothetical protein
MALLVRVECSWALVYSAIILVVEDERGGSGSEDGYARQPR